MEKVVGPEELTYEESSGREDGGEGAKLASFLNRRRKEVVKREGRGVWSLLGKKLLFKF